MTSNRSELKNLFSDGKLPTGNDFANLIDSLAHTDEFVGQGRAFDEWKKRGEVQFGIEDDSWQLGADGHGNVRLARGDDEKNKGNAADIQLNGWVSMTGRLGNANDPTTFAGSKSELKVDALPSVSSDGLWHTIVSMPGHPCAFEVTAATALRVSTGKPGVKAALRWLAGAQKLRNSIVHTVATATGTNEKPHLTAQSNPAIAGNWQGLRRYFVALFAALVATGVLTDPAATSELSGDKAETGVLPESGATSSPNLTEEQIGVLADLVATYDPNGAKAETGVLTDPDATSDLSGAKAKKSVLPEPGATSSPNLTKAQIGVLTDLVATYGPNGTKAETGVSTDRIADSGPNGPKTKTAMSAATSLTANEQNEAYGGLLGTVQNWRNAVDPANANGSIAPFIALVIGNLLIAGRLAMRSITRQRGGVRLKWVQEGGGIMAGDSQWSLKLRGPASDDSSADDKVYYHITKLWN